MLSFDCKGAEAQSVIKQFMKILNQDADAPMTNAKVDVQDLETNGIS